MRNSVDRIWDAIELNNQVGVKALRWEIGDKEDFQCHPYTTGWGVVTASEISHRVLMQPMNHGSLEGFFWLNELIEELMHK